jgi:hypothetical protein
MKPFELFVRTELGFNLLNPISAVTCKIIGLIGRTGRKYYFKI